MHFSDNKFTLISFVQSRTHAKRHQTFKLSTSLNSASPAIVRNAAILNLLKIANIWWYEYYLTLSSTLILLASCIHASNYGRLSQNVDTYAPSMLTTRHVPFEVISDHKQINISKNESPTPYSKISLHPKKMFS